MDKGRIVILTGAGISAESGIRTFRGADGLWEGHRIEDVASPQGFARDPALVYEFYNIRRRQLLSAEIKPNPAHTALARLERDYEGEVVLVTQNIDNLHERGGSRKVLHMHGELLKARCDHCGGVLEWMTDFDRSSVCAECKSTGGLRPHVVWFGEMPLYMDAIYKALTDCAVFAAIGTSGNVYPAAGFVEMAQGARTVELNLEPSAVHSSFDEAIYGPAGSVVPQWVDALLEGKAS